MGPEPFTNAYVGSSLSLNSSIFNRIHPYAGSVFFCPSVLEVQMAYRQNASDFYLDDHEWQTNINIASSNFADNGLCYLLSSVGKKIYIRIYKYGGSVYLCIKCSMLW